MWKYRTWLALVFVATFVPQGLAQDPNVVGQWSSPVLMKPTGYAHGTLGIHSILLHTGKVLCVELPEFPDPNSADIVVIDPNNPDPNSIQVAWEGTGTEPEDKWPNGHWLFCGGHAQVDGGRILFSGGDPSCEDGGLAPYKTTIYEPDSEGGAGTWIAGPDEVWDIDDAVCPPDLGERHTRRFYPTITRIYDGRLLISDGTCLCDTGNENEDYGNPDTPVLLTWPSLTEDYWEPLHTAEVNTETNPFDLGFIP